MNRAAGEVRYAEVEHEEKNLRVQVVLDLDGGTRRDIATGLSVLDVLITEVAYFAGIDLGIAVDWDGTVDEFRITQAVGATIGKAMAEVLSQRVPVERIGSSLGVAGDALVQVALDLQGSGVLVNQLQFQGTMLGAVSTQSLHEFLQQVVSHSRIDLHLVKMHGTHDRKVAEAAFKATGVALGTATRRNLHHRDLPTRNNG